MSARPERGLSAPERTLSAPERSRLAELEAVVERGLQTFLEVGRALAEIRDRRLYRETQHATFQAYLDDRWGFGRAHGYRLIDAARVAELVSPIGDIANEAQARELVPVLRREGEQALLDVYRELQAEHGIDVSAERIRRLLTARFARQQREQELAEHRAHLIADAAALADSGDRWRVETCDLRSLDLPPISIDVIVTDPPYEPEYLPLYEDLASLAARVLKPGGSLHAMAAHAHMYDVHGLLGRHLTYVWTVGYVMPPPGARMFQKGLIVGWKPVLWFAKGTRQLNGRLVRDVVTSPASDKRFHEWGQSVDGMAGIVDKFSRPGDLLLDPFLGAGTTGVAAIRLGRRFIGCDVDPDAVAVARSRLAEEEARK